MEVAGFNQSRVIIAYATGENPVFHQKVQLEREKKVGLFHSESRLIVLHARLGTT